MDGNYLKMVKSMKSSYVLLGPNYVLGTDRSDSILTVIYAGSDVDFIGTVQELEGKETPIWVTFNYNYLYNSMRQKLFSIQSIISREPVCVIDDIREIDSYINYQNQNYKAADGANRISLYDKYQFYLYPSLIPANKPDRIMLKIYEYDQISFLQEFTIFKKGYEIKQYIRCHYL